MAKHITSIYLDEALREQYHERAAELDRSVNWLMNRALWAWIDPAESTETRKLADA
jgi:predicted transcriptional regulator